MTSQTINVIVGGNIDAVYRALAPMSRDERFLILSHILGQTCFDITDLASVADREHTADQFVGRATRLMFEAIRGCAERERAGATKQ